MLPDATGNARKISLRQLEGRDEVLVLAHSRPGAPLVTDLLAQVIVALDETTPAREQVATLTLGERDILLAHIRQENFGDQLQSTSTCPRCHEQLDIDFSLEAFLIHYRPRLPRGVEPQENGWFRFANHNVSFRLPTGTDMEEMEQQAGLTYEQRRRWLIARCVSPTHVSARLLARIERAMWHLSPQLIQELGAQCAMCGANFSVTFNMESFVLRELRLAARTLYQDVHLLARWYHWREAEILSLPRQRRIRYVDELMSDLRGQI